MKAALRDAKRAEAIRDRPKGSTFAHAANGRREKRTATCSACGNDINDLGGRATTGICRNCISDARRAREAVIRSRQKEKANHAVFVAPDGHVHDPTTDGRR